MKVLNAGQMREVDSRTIEAGIPGLILMENAGSRVVDLIAEKFAPLGSQRIAVLCGKGNNGGDGLVIARQLFTRFRPQSLDVVLAADPSELHGDAAGNYQMLVASGCPIRRTLSPEMRDATLVVDALLGTGVSGPARGEMLEMIRAINTAFPLARVVAVDIPSGLPSDSADCGGEFARADYTVTFTAPKIAHAMPPNCDRMGELRVVPVGSPAALFADAEVELVEPGWFAPLFGPRKRAAHKGDFGHVLVIAGARGKTGAAAMAGTAALRAGAGLVTVATAESALDAVASHIPELMTEPLPETDTGSISQYAFDSGRMAEVLKGKTVVAIGPGLTTHPDTVAFVRRCLSELPVPVVADADALNAMAGGKIPAPALRVLTPHPGEMARLSGKSTAEVQADRLGCAREFAAADGKVMLVLKGQRTLMAFPGGRLWINPTGTPAMATGGTGDILTGLIAGLLAQFQAAPELAAAAAVWLHGRAGELGAGCLGEKALIATDLLRFLPEAMEECARLHGQD